MASTYDRFVAKIAPEPMSGCWLWTANTVRGGYGQLSVNGWPMLAHRFSWEHHNGRPVPDGMMVCHSCDNPACVNPAHFFLGTSKDNKQDSVRKDRHFKPQGEKHGASKLTEERVGLLRSLPQLTFEHAKRLAAEWGCNWRNLYRARSGERWGHI